MCSSARTSASSSASCSGSFSSAFRMSGTSSFETCTAAVYHRRMPRMKAQKRVPASRLALDTLAVHAAQPPDPHTGAVNAAIQLSTTFAQDGPGAHRGFEYARTDNPTRRTLEQCIAALEGGKQGIAFGSGCAATTAITQLLRPGDHIVACDDVYGGTFRIFDKLTRPMGVDVTWVDMTD